MNALDGKVAIITGAGRGIGRAHALRFAAEGAAVVVNDRGTANDGSGADTGPAQDVVEEIVAAGGRAVANADDISTWEGARRLVCQAVEEFGTLDVLVNNAGILRDRFITGMDESEWDAVIAVHLKGHFAMLRHAADHWKARSKAGVAVRASVVNTASASGTFMTLPGQANYGSAKAGIAELTQVAAAELQRYGVRVNAIAPVARTRLTLATPGMGEMFAKEVPDGEFDTLAPENVAPVAAYLAGDACPFTGRVLAVQGGTISALDRWRVGETVETDGPWEIDDLHKRLSAWA